MRCLCEYETQYNYSNGNYERTLGDEDFILIDGQFTIEEETGDYYVLTQTEKVELYACPKCNTVQMQK